jgi:hypothetical protein
VTLWRAERVERTPNSDPDPATATFRIHLREQDTGTLDVVLVAMDVSAQTDPDAILNVLCNDSDPTHTPNDWNCP